MRSGARHLFVLSAALCAGACQFVGASAYNLDQLHPAEGRHAHVAPLQSHWGWGARVGATQLFGKYGEQVSAVSPEAVEDPVERCVEELNVLRGFDSDDFGVASTQVEYFARTAAFDPWGVSREIAVRELGRAARRLDLAAHAIDLRVPTTSDEQAGAALEKLVQRAAPAIQSPSEEHRAALAAACDEMAALPLDVPSGLRVLHGLNALLRAGSPRDARLEPLRALSLALQRRLVTQALELALNDAPPAAASGSDPGWPNPRVQGAAVRACVDVWGAPKLAELLARNPFAGLGGERLVATLDCVARIGLPEAPGQGGPALRARWAEAIYATAVEHPDGSVRMAAMRALGTLSGRGLYTLQDVEWQKWWLEEGARMAQATVGERRP